MTSIKVTAGYLGGDGPITFQIGDPPMTSVSYREYGSAAGLAPDVWQEAWQTIFDQVASQVRSAPAITLTDDAGREKCPNCGSTLRRWVSFGGCFSSGDDDEVAQSSQECRSCFWQRIETEHRNGRVEVEIVDSRVCRCSCHKGDVAIFHSRPCCDGENGAAGMIC